MKNLAQTADRLVKSFAKIPEARFWTGEEMRDRIDLATGGELDYQPLNILQDMVEERLANALNPVPVASMSTRCDPPLECIND